MGMFDFLNGGAGGSAQAGYDEAQGYLNPYIQRGTQGFDQWRQSTNAMGQNIANAGPNMGQPQWQSTQMSPQQYYQNIMTGYQESPQAAYAREQAMRAGNSAAAASGMMGSGAFVNGMQRNANQISQGDQQQYFNNVMGSNQAQMGALQNYQNYQNMYNNQLYGQTNIGANAANMGANYAMQNGQNQAYWDNQGINNAMGLAGMAAGYY